jgi:Ca2+-binding RTX toxin-like protein
MVFNPSFAPSGNFSLGNWKLTLPTDTSGRFIGTAVEVKSLAGYRNNKYFYTGSDGAMVFTAPVEGATTSGSKYARSELREMKGTARAAWNLQQGGTMSATLEVDQVPTLFKGTGGRIVVGQIHGQNDELVRLYWENNTVYFKNDKAGPWNTELRFDLKNAFGKKPSISLNERFSYTLSAKGDYLDVNVYADGQVYKSHTRINDAWDKDTFYFKAGAYLGVNETQGRGIGQTSFYALRFKHADGAASSSSVSSLLKGSNANNIISGKAQKDTIQSYGGADKLYGKGGNDILTGGTGKDSFVFDTTPNSKSNMDVITDFNVRDDMILLNDSTYAGLKAGRLPSGAFIIGDKANDTNDRIIYNNKTGALLYDPDGSGPASPIQFAKIGKSLSLTASDFLII